MSNKVTATIRMRKDLKEELDSHVTRHGDVTFFIEEAVTDWLKKNKKKQKSEPKAKFDPYQFAFTIPNINLSSWEKWVNFRKKKRKPISEDAAGSQLPMLAEYSMEVQDQIIMNSINGDYQGLFRPKVKALQVKGDSTREMTLDEQLNDRSWADE